MNKVNNMRAGMLSKFTYKGDMCKMMTSMLHNTPSCTTVWNCNMCAKSSYSVKFEFIKVNNSDELSKLVSDIATHLEKLKTCQHCCNTCKNMMPVTDHILNYHLFITLANIKGYSLGEIPEIIKIQKADYVLFGVLLIIHPIVTNDDDHYVAAIKVNASWSVFDDKKSKPYFVSKKKKFSIHSLLYTKKLENENKAVKKSYATINKATKSLRKRKAENCKENFGFNVKRKSVRNISHILQSTGIENNLSASTPLPSFPQRAPVLNFEESAIESIGILANGSSYEVNNVRLILRNTCSFDSIAQVNRFLIHCKSSPKYFNIHRC